METLFKYLVRLNDRWVKFFPSSVLRTIGRLEQLYGDKSPLPSRTAYIKTQNPEINAPQA